MSMTFRQFGRTPHRAPKVFTNLLYTPIVSSGPTHMPRKRLLRCCPRSSATSEMHIAANAETRNRLDGIFAACCSIIRVSKSS